MNIINGKIQIGTGWRRRQEAAAERIVEKISQAQDEERQRIRDERAKILAAKRAGEEAERAELAKHALVPPLAEIAGHVQGIGHVKRSFLPFLQDAVALYLAAHPDQRPRQAVSTYLRDGVLHERSAEEMAGKVASAEERTSQERRAAEKLPSLNDRILAHAGEVQPMKRGRGRPRKVEFTSDGALMEDDDE